MFVPLTVMTIASKQIYLLYLVIHTDRMRFTQSKLAFLYFFYTDL